MDISDRLEVRLWSADGLPLVDGGPPSTFGEIVVGPDTKRTGVMTESKNPKWESDPLIFTDILSQGSDAVLIYIKHVCPDGSEKPLGVVVIPTDGPFASPRMELDGTYDLMPTTGMDIDEHGMQSVQGSVRVRMTYFSTMDPELQMNSMNIVDSKPNMLNITVIDGTGIGTRYKSGIDAVVTIQIGDLKASTKVAKKSNDPEWNEKLSIPVEDGAQLVEITVVNSSLVRNIFMGRTRIPLNEIAETADTGLTRSFTLYNQNLQFDESMNYGQIQLQLAWVFNQQMDDERKAKRKRWKWFRRMGKVAGAVGSVASFVGGGVAYVGGGVASGAGAALGITGRPDKGAKFKKKKKGAAGGGDDDDDEDEDGDEDGEGDQEQEAADTSGYRMADQFDLSTMSPFEVAQYLDGQRKNRRDELKDLLVHEEEELEIPEGDYNIQVHLLEISDLVLHRSGSMPSPMVYVECLGKKFHSRPIYETTSDFFDEIFYFTMKGLTKDQIREARVKLTVVDHYWLDVLKRGWFDSIIGVYQIDLLSVYCNQDHELHRKWGTLRNPHSGSDSGRQGLVKFSVVCLAPGDRQKYHDPQKEDDDQEAEDDVDKVEGSGVVDAGLRSPTQSLQFLVIGIVRVEGLPGYDRWISTTRTGLWAYCQAEFAGCQPVKTSKVATSGHENLTVTFEEELWIPVWLPNSCKRFSISVKNRELGRYTQVIGTTYIDFDEVKKYEEDPVESAGLSSWAGYKGKYQGEMLKLLHFYGANPAVRTGATAAKFMNKFPNYGSSYRGTMLASLRVVKRSPTSDAAHRQGMSYSIPEELMPPYSTYNLKVFCFQGSDFGSSGKHAQSGSGVLWSDDYSVSISVGRYEAATGFKAYSDGAVDWLELCEGSDMVLPRDMSALPDTFITVYKGSPSSYTSVAYLRVPTIELLSKGTKSEPVWYDLKHDQSHRNTPTVGFPGSVLLRISLVNTQDIGMIGDWETDRKRMEVKKPYALWCHIYQARGLPSINTNGMIDPYIKARFAGTKAKTKFLRNTQNPVFFQTLEFAKEIPEDLRLAPNLLLQVWDANVLTGFPVGALRVQMRDVKVSTNVNYNPEQTPTWQPLVGIDGKGDMGEVLCSFLLIELKKVDQNFPPPRAIEPPLRKAYLDIHLVGLRNLVKRGFGNIRNPYLQFDLVSTGYGESIKTPPSRLPAPSNPNYLERQIVPVNIPDNPLYCPALEVQVWDQRTLDRAMLGVITIDLRSKLPWNGNEYVPPRQHAILSEAQEAKKQLRAQKAKKSAADKAAQKSAKAAALVKLGKGKAADESKGGKGSTKNPLLSRRADGFDGSSDEEDDEEQFMLPDEGQGVFPPEPGARELGSQYSTLPPIVDADEEEEAKRRRMMAYLREQRAEDQGAISVNDHSEKAALAKAIGFPVSWTAQNFMQDRDWWMQSTKKGEGGQLEDFMQTYAFEHYDIMRGHLAFNKYDKRRATLKQVGQLKGVIRVTMKNPRMDEEYNAFARSYRVPEKVVVRVYVIKAQNLLPMDIFGSADPYLKVQLGETEHRDKKTLQKRTLAPEFFAAYEFHTTMSGPGQLKIGLWDRNTISSDQVIGETVIDLEDRWFHPKWNELDKKPAEIRTLFKPGQATSQGLLTMWVDIYTQEDAALEENRMVEIQGPEKKEYQLRIVTWRSLDVPDVDGGASDLFLQFGMQGSDKKYRTDTHWRCKKGLGSWNYRTLVELELPMKKREEGRLTIEMMERNIITSNTLIGSHVYNLYDWLMLAYRRQSSVFPLKEKKEVLKRLAKERAKKMAFAGDATVDEGLDEEELDDDEGEDDNEGGGGGVDDGGSDAGDSLDGEGPSETEPMLPIKTASSTYGSAPEGVAIAVPAKGGGGGGGSLVPSKGGGGSEEEKEEDEEDDESNIDALFNQVNVFLGVGEAVADDADWFSISTKDKDTGAEIYSGRIALSLSLVPKEEYENDPVGKARDEPNKDPYLPPPQGRLSFTLNPLAILKELCSPRVICCIICCLVCMVLVTAMIFISSQLSGLVAFYQLFSSDD